MRMISDGMLDGSSFMGAPGVEEVRWLAPVRPGERLTVRATVLETRASRSRQDMGFVKFRYELFGSAERRLMTLVVSPMIGRRAAGRRSHEVLRRHPGRRNQRRGAATRSRPKTIKSFAARFDPQPFHLDEEAAAAVAFQRLCASGWHTVSIRMRLLIDSRRREDDERRARGEPVATLGPSPGFRELKWLKPVYAGDTVSYQTEVIEKRALPKLAGLGVGDIAQHRQEPARRAGDIVHQHGVRRAPL